MMIHEFLNEFNDYENGHLFMNSEYYPDSIRGLCEFLESRDYVQYIGSGCWVKVADIPSVEEVEYEIEKFMRGHRKFVRNVSSYLRTVFKQR